MQLDPTSEKPIFIQIADNIEDAILSGAFGEEEQIPSITEFAVSCKINPATALKGINLLVDSGILYKKRGVGMFVTQGAKQALREKRKTTFKDDYVVPMVDEAQQLDISKGEVDQMVKACFDQHK